MDALPWLLDSDPAIRWQVLRDLGDAPDEQVVAERARVAHVGWGAQLLAARGADGLWAGGACFPGDFRGDLSQGQPWTSTYPTLTLLREFGVEPSAVQDVIADVAANCRWEYAGEAFFDGEVEPCINGRTVGLGAYFGRDVDGIVTRLLGEQLADGGWNCEAENGSVRASFHTTMCVLDGLLEYRRAGGAIDVADAHARGVEYLLERRLFRRASTGAPADPALTRLAFPTWWHYDVLWALDHLRAAGGAPDPRTDEAVELVRGRQQSDGRWLLEHVHPGAMHFPIERPGEPSRWLTLRALRVLRWHDA